MTLAAARTAVAAALSTVVGVDVHARPTVPQPRTGDGWVVVTRIVPADYTHSTVTFTAIVVLGADEALAEQRLEDWAIPLIDAITGSTLPVADVSLAPELLLAGTNNAPVYAAALTLTMEV